MAVFKCKMCGGDLEITLEMTVVECDYCGTQQTLPKLDDERRVNLYDRANHFRRNNDYDKAMGLYEKILDEDRTDSEAYWSLILCRYGIEYVEDPATRKRVPTINRAQYTSIYADEDYKSAIQYADTTQKRIYEEEAKYIDSVQKEILEISKNEEPFDVFICYKESDESGRRTRDSVLANDLYHLLTQEGFKVFYARITLEDKLGTAYEPYIFAALNSAKVMVVLGTKPEYFNAVWVKNEWSRYLALIRKGEKKMLIPAYRDMDPYDLPEEFSHLQAQDMNKLGFMQDLIRGIKKILETDVPKKEETVVSQTVIQQTSGNTTAGAQIKRGNMALEDHEWEKADGFFEEALNIDPECAEAYLGKLLAQKKQVDLAALFQMYIAQYESPSLEQLEACAEETVHINAKVDTYVIKGYLSEDKVRNLYNFNRMYSSAFSSRKSQKAKQKTELEKERLLSRAQQYAKGDLADQLTKGLDNLWELLDQRIAKAEQEDLENKQRLVEKYSKHIESADKQAEEIYKEADLRREGDYQTAVSSMEKANSVSEYESARSKFVALGDYKDSKSNVDKCLQEINRLEEEKRQEEKLQAGKAAKKKKKIIAGVAGAIAACVAGVVVVTQVIIPNNRYKAAIELKESGQYEEAIHAFEEMDGYKDSVEQIESCYMGLMGEEAYKWMKTAKAGDEYIFGAYEQDGDTANGKEDIEWIVLDKEGTKILVVSKYALDSIAYNVTEKKVTWESCTLRGWLNDTFIINAFDENDRAKIVETMVTADKNPKYSTDPGADTTDKVFLLSIPEVEKYFANEEERKCVPTEYAIAQGAWTSDEHTSGGKATCWWWLRSPGYHAYYAADVYYDGSVNNDGVGVDRDERCVRPALWINLAS